MKNLIFVFALLLGPSCSVSVRVPGNRFHSPETLAAKKLTAGIGRAGMAKVELTSDYSRHYVGDRDFNLTYSSSVNGSFGVGLHDRVEVGAFYNYESSTSLYGKIKIIDNELSNGHRIIFSGVLSLGLGGDSQDQIQTTLNTSTTASIDLNYFTTDQGLLLGYTLGEDFLPYLGVYYSRLLASGEQKINGLQRDVHASINSPSAVYGFQYKISRNINFVAEGAYSKVGASTKESDWFPNTFKRDFHTWGVKFNIN